jgi:hypothetical protein
MAYKDFTDRTWRVCKSDAPTRCQVNDIVTFFGPENDVTVQCNQDHSYGPGEYFSENDKNGERIEGLVEQEKYTITITDTVPKYRILAAFTGVAGGSWTAEDNPPGPEDGG